MDSTDNEYEQLMKSRALLRNELDSGGVVDESGDMGEGVGYDAIRKANLSQGSSGMGGGAQSKAGGVSAAGGALTTGGAMGANPYVAGAGLALQTLGAVDDAKRQSEQAKIDAYNKKIMAQRSAIRNFFA